MDSPVRVRMAPSPTGHLHVGTARTALFNYLFAKHYGGTFILRLEDTDAERSSDAFAREIVQGLQWLGIDWDEGPYLAPDGAWASRGEYGPYKQSERAHLYRSHLEQLLADGKAYWCYCTREELDAEREAQVAAGLAPRYGGRCRDLPAPPAGRAAGVVRFRTPSVPVTFTDLVRGSVTADMSLVGDMVIARSLDSALYNFAVVVDDILMGISHVIRGEDHISNTPKQLVLFDALGYAPPVYAHLPLNLDENRKKLSKRTGEVSLLSYRDEGYLPAALVNFFALLGWHPADDQELFTLPELAAAFTIERVQRAGSVFDLQKLRWINREHMRRAPVEWLASLVRGHLPESREPVEAATLERFVEAERERAYTLSELGGAAGWLVSYAPPSASVLLSPGSTPEQVRLLLGEFLAALDRSGETGTWVRAAEDWLSERASTHGKREVFWPVRVALSGLASSPDPVTLMRVLGYDETRGRLSHAASELRA